MQTNKIGRGAPPSPRRTVASTLAGSCNDRPPPLHLYTFTPLYLHTFIPLHPLHPVHLYTFKLPCPYTSTPPRPLQPRTPLHHYTFTPSHLYSSTFSHTRTPLASAPIAPHTHGSHTHYCNPPPHAEAVTYPITIARAYAFPECDTSAPGL